MAEFQQRFRVLKTDPDRRIVYGWANVIAKGPDLGHLQLIVDADNELMFERDLEDAAHGFNLDARAGSDAHGPIISKCVASVPFTRDLQRALGIEKLRDPETGKMMGMVGWLTGFLVDDEEVWAKVKSGDYSMFSIGGSSELADLPEDFDLTNVDGQGL